MQLSIHVFQTNLDQLCVNKNSKYGGKNVINRNNVEKKFGLGVIVSKGLARSRFVRRTEQSSINKLNAKLLII